MYLFFQTDDTLPEDCFSVSDPDHDKIVYALVPNEHSSYFSINSSSGLIKYNINYICSKLNPCIINLEVKATDSYGLYCTTQLYVSLNKLNRKPILTNLPAAIAISEDTPVHSWIYTIEVHDTDGDLINYRFNFSPKFARNYIKTNISGKSFKPAISLLPEFKLVEYDNFLKPVSVCSTRNYTFSVSIFNHQ